MKLKHQVLSAVSATALMLAGSAALVIAFGTTSEAARINPAVRAALMSAVDHPTDALQALISQMNSEVPGSGAQFARAFRDNDTDGVAAALAAIVDGNSTLQDTIASALSTLAAEPQLAAVKTAKGGTINGSTVVSSIDTAVLNQNFASNSKGPTNNDGDHNKNNDKQTLQNTLNTCPANDAKCLQNLNPGAGPPGFANFGQGSVNNIFTRGNPNQNFSQVPGFTHQQATNSGRPNSRA